MALSQQAVLQVLSVVLLVFLTAPRRSSLQPDERNNSSRVDDLGFEPFNISGRKHAKTSYVLTLRYNGQQSAGIRSLFSQQCWIGAYNLSAYVVEPFIYDSYVESLGIDLANQRLGLNDFFDINHLVKKTKAMGYGQLASWKEFVHKAPWDVIYIETKNTHRWKLKQAMTPKTIWSANSKGQCYIPTQPSFNTRINFLLQKLTFCIVKVVKLYTSNTVPFRAEDFTDYILAGRKLEETVLVFDKWSGPWHVPHRLEESSVCEDAHERSLHGSLRPSRMLQTQAAAYERIHSGGHPFKVAVMIRSEHVLHSLTRYQHLQKCFHQGIVTTDRLTKNGQTESPFVTLDIGKYGSASFVHFRFEHTLNVDRAMFYRTVKRAFKRFIHEQFRFKEWQDSFSVVADGVEDRGYIAALQRTIASRADCLVLMGGGQFIKVALHQYLDSHSCDEWCIKFVCVGGRYQEEYEEILRMKETSPH